MMVHLENGTVHYVVYRYLVLWREPIASTSRILWRWRGLQRPGGKVDAGACADCPDPSKLFIGPCPWHFTAFSTPTGWARTCASCTVAFNLLSRVPVQCVILSHPGHVLLSFPTLKLPCFSSRRQDGLGRALPARHPQDGVWSHPHGPPTAAGGGAAQAVLVMQTP